MKKASAKRRLIVGVSGASGAILGYRLLQALADLPQIETHLIVSDGGKNVIRLAGLKLADFAALADRRYDDCDLGAPVASGSFQTDGMIVAPCSMKTLSAIATGYAANLLVRAADVCLKENRRVVLVPREMPLGRIHLRNLSAAAEAGCTIVPPMLTFYNSPRSLSDQIDHILGKIFMQFDLDFPHFKPWNPKDNQANEKAGDSP